MGNFTKLPTSRRSPNGRNTVGGGASGGATEASPSGFFADSADALQTAITNHPGFALGAALAVGVLLGWLIKRK